MHLAATADSPAPTITALTHLAAMINGIDYPREGLTLERMGLAGKTPGKIRSHRRTRRRTSRRARHQILKSGPGISHSEFAIDKQRIVGRDESVDTGAEVGFRCTGIDRGLGQSTPTSSNGAPRLTPSPLATVLTTRLKSTCRITS